MNFSSLFHIQSIIFISASYFKNGWLVIAYVVYFYAYYLCFEKIDKKMREICVSGNNFGYIFSTAFFHRFLIISAIGFLLWSDFWRFDINKFNHAALSKGATLSASSSWLPMYPVTNAILNEKLITNEAEDWEKNLASSWCANTNATGHEWI